MKSDLLSVSRNYKSLWDDCDLISILFPWHGNQAGLGLSESSLDKMNLSFFLLSRLFKGPAWASEFDINLHDYPVNEELRYWIGFCSLAIALEMSPKNIFLRSNLRFNLNCKSAKYLNPYFLNFNEWKVPEMEVFTLLRMVFTHLKVLSTSSFFALLVTNTVWLLTSLRALKPLSPSEIVVQFALRCFWDQCFTVS